MRSQINRAWLADGRIRTVGVVAVLIGITGWLEFQHRPAGAAMHTEAVQTSDDMMSYSPALLIQLAVSDLERSMKFYGDVLELQQIAHQPELEWAKYSTRVKGATIGIGRQDVVSGSGSASINIGVTDVDAARSLLESRGVHFPKPSVNIPGVVKLADFTDPDGNRLRLAGPPD